jgi:hypothetical protein
VPAITSEGPPFWTRSARRIAANIAKLPELSRSALPSKRQQRSSELRYLIIGKRNGQLISLYAGSLVFTPPNHPVDLKDWSAWWRFLKGANWRHPYGRKSNIHGLDNHPVVHVAYSSHEQNQGTSTTPPILQPP